MLGNPSTTISPICHGSSMNHAHCIGVRELTCILLPLCTWKLEALSKQSIYSWLGDHTLVNNKVSKTKLKKNNSLSTYHGSRDVIYVSNNFVVNVEDGNENM